MKISTCATAKKLKTPGLRRTIHSLRHGQPSRATCARESLSDGNLTGCAWKVASLSPSRQLRDSLGSRRSSVASPCVTSR